MGFSKRQQLALFLSFILASSLIIWTVARESNQNQGKYEKCLSIGDRALEIFEKEYAISSNYSIALNKTVKRVEQETIAKDVTINPTKDGISWTCHNMRGGVLLVRW